MEIGSIASARECSGQRLEQSAAEVVDADRVRQQFQERLRLLIPQRYGRQKLISLPVHQPTIRPTSKYK